MRNERKVKPMKISGQMKWLLLAGVPVYVGLWLGEPMLGFLAGLAILIYAHSKKWDT